MSAGGRVGGAWLSLLLLVLAMPAGLGAQLCRGAPLAAGGARVSALFGLPEGAQRQWGTAAAYRFGAPVSVRASYRRTGYEESAAATTAFRVGAAAVLAERPAGGGSEDMSLCLTAGFERARLEGLTLHTIPVGLALGILVPFSRAWDGLLHVEPRLVRTRGSVAGLSDAALSPGVRAGAGVTRGRLVLGGGYEWVRARRFNHAFTLELGVRIGGGAGGASDPEGRAGGSRQ